MLHLYTFCVKLLVSGTGLNPYTYCVEARLSSLPYMHYNLNNHEHSQVTTISLLLLARNHNALLEDCV